MSKHKDFVFSILINMLKDPMDAQEATQDTFVKVFRRIHSYSDQSKFTTWLYSIAYRTGLDYLKKRKKTLSLDDKEMHIQATFHNQNPEVILESKDRKKRILELISTLTPEEAAVIRMFYFKELSLKEIAEITHLSLANVKVKLYRARQSIKTHLKSSLTHLSDA